MSASAGIILKRKANSSSTTTRAEHGDKNRRQRRCMNPMLLKNATEDELEHLRQLTSKPGSKIKYLAFARKEAGVHYVFAHAPDPHSVKQWRLFINPRLVETGEDIKDTATAIEIARTMDGFEQFGTARASSQHVTTTSSMSTLDEPATTTTITPPAVVEQPAMIVMPSSSSTGFKVKSAPFTSSSFSTQGIVTRVVPRPSSSGAMIMIDPIQYVQARYGQADPVQLALVRDSFAGETKRMGVQSQAAMQQTAWKRKRAAGSQQADD
jgi:hypothetical protein